MDCGSRRLWHGTRHIPRLSSSVEIWMSEAYSVTATRLDEPTNKFIIDHVYFGAGILPQQFAVCRFGEGDRKLTFQ